MKKLELRDIIREVISEEIDANSTMATNIYYFLQDHEHEMADNPKDIQTIRRTKALLAIMMNDDDYEKTFGKIGSGQGHQPEDFARGT